MTADTPIATCSTVEEFISHLHLVDVRLVDFRGNLRADTDSTSVELSTRLRQNRGILFTDFRFEVTTEESYTSVDLSASWDSEAPIGVTADALKDFVSRVGFMTVYPYAREAIARTQMGLRVEISTLDIVRPGTVEIELEDDDFTAIVDELVISREYALRGESSASD